MHKLKQVIYPVVFSSLAVVLIGCASGMATMKPSLYERLGGKEAIIAVVDDATATVAADARINKRFASTDVALFKQRFVEQLCAATGGPCTYSGRDMKTVHAGMNISDAEFSALGEDLAKSLGKHKVPAAEQNELLALLASMKEEIIGASHMAPQSAEIPFPNSYREWYHVKSRINQEGHSVAGNVGFQHIYANPLALAGLKSGSYANGATFALDRLNYTQAEDQITREGDRKVLVVMVKDEARYPTTGGWGFEGFKGGDPKQRVVKDGGAKCFTCHAPLEKDGFVFSKLRD